MALFGKLPRLLAAAALTSMIASAPALARTFVYVSNAEDGDIGLYRLMPDGELVAGARTPAAQMVMPMAVSPDRRFLYAASRTKPHTVHVYAIDSASGALSLLSTAPLPMSMPYLSLDRTGRFLFGVSYGDHLVSVNAVGMDGRVRAEPVQLVPVGRNAHAIRIDRSNRFVFVPTLGTDQVFQFVFDPDSGRLASNTPAVAQMPPGTGPRHFVISRDNRFVYVLGELTATVTTFALDDDSGLLTELGSVSGLPPDTPLTPGAPRLPIGTAGAAPPRDLDNDIWAADIQMTPDGRFLYLSERTGSTLETLAVDGATGTLRWLGSTPTEKQPRGFAIDPGGRYLIATGQQSDTLSVYAIDADCGALALLRQYPTGKDSNWVEIVSFD
jgi:6-phosphogluconolactonase